MHKVTTEFSNVNKNYAVKELSKLERNSACTANRGVDFIVSLPPSYLQIFSSAP
jgi:hypothetical protein